MIRYAAATGHVSPATVIFLKDIGKVAQANALLLARLSIPSTLNVVLSDANNAVGYAGDWFGAPQQAYFLTCFQTSESFTVAHLHSATTKTGAKKLRNLANGLKPNSREQPPWSVKPKMA